MRRQTNLRVLMHYFALALYPGACVLQAQCRKSGVVLFVVVCVRIAVLRQIYAKIIHSRNHASVQILRIMAIACIHTLCCFFGVSSRHFSNTASGRQFATSWPRFVATRCLALKTCCKCVCFFIVDIFWWKSREANKHTYISQHNGR